MLLFPPPALHQRHEKALHTHALRMYRKSADTSRTCTHMWMFYLYTHVEQQRAFITCIGTQRNPRTSTWKSNKMTEQTHRTQTALWKKKKQRRSHDRSQRTSWLNCLALDSRRPPACVCCQGDCLWALIAYNCMVTQRARSCSLSSSQNHVEAKYNLDQTSLCRSTKLVINLTRGTHQNKMHRSDTIN